MRRHKHIIKTSYKRNLPVSHAMSVHTGFIITGAPVEQMEFEEVDYWQELTEIKEWTKKNVTSTLHLCWGAQAGIYYHYGINKKALPKKLSVKLSHFNIFK